MARRLDHFERIAREAGRFTDLARSPDTTSHPFDVRNIHPDLPSDVRRLFDDGHFAQATFEAFKFVDEEVQRISGDGDFGKSLMMRVFGGVKPIVRINPGMTTSERNEQEGYQFIYAGAMQGIRNPRGHKTGVTEDLDTCLDHLGFASMLLRKLDAAGLR